MKRVRIILPDTSHIRSIYLGVRFEIVIFPDVHATVITRLDVQGLGRGSSGCP